MLGWESLASELRLLIFAAACAIGFQESPTDVNGEALGVESGVTPQWDHDSAEAVFVSTAQCEVKQIEAKHSAPGSATGQQYERRLAAQYWPVNTSAEAVPGGFHWLWLRPRPEGYEVLAVSVGPHSSTSGGRGLALVLLPSWPLESQDCVGWHARAKSTPFGFRPGGVPVKWSRGALPSVGAMLTVHGSALRAYGIRLGPAPLELLSGEGEKRETSAGLRHLEKPAFRPAAALTGVAHVDEETSRHRKAGTAGMPAQRQASIFKALQCSGDWERLRLLLSQLDMQVITPDAFFQDEDTKDAKLVEHSKNAEILADAVSLARRLFTQALKVGSIRAQLLRAQQALLGPVAIRKAPVDVAHSSERGNFCPIGYLAAVALLLQHKPEVFLDQGGVVAASAHLREALINFEPTALLWYVDDAGWPLQAHMMLSAADRSGSDKPWGLALHSEVMPGLSSTSSRAPDHRKALLVPLICSHAYLADSLLALKGHAVDVTYYGHSMAETYSTTVCNVVPCHHGRLNRIMDRLQHPPAGPDSSDSVEVWRSLRSRSDITELQSELHQAWAEDSTLGSSNAIVCGYPVALCLALDGASWRMQPLLLVMAGNPLAEYLAPELHPWAFGVVAQLLAERRILTHSRLDALAVFPSVFPGAPAPHLVFFGARYAPILARSPPRFDEKKVLVTRLQKLFLQGDTDGLWRLMRQAEEEVLQGAAVFEQLDREYRFEELLGYRAFVVFPWDWDLTTFREWHVMGFPLYVPCESWMLSIMFFANTFFPDRFIRFRREWWEHGAPRDERTMGDPISPWLDERLGPLIPQISRLLPLTDYFSSPHISHFESIADLAGQLVLLDPLATHRRMIVGREARLRSSAAQLCGALRRLLQI